MKINNLTNGLVVALLLASPVVGADTQYPAADFEPKVIYQDAEYIGQNKSASAEVSTKQAKPADVDSQYPAADFEPKVLYKDADYKKSTATGSSSASESAATDDVAASGVEKVEDESMLSYLLGLGVFAVAGYAFLRKREPKVKTSSSTPVYSGHMSGLSGVARYIRKHNLSAVTGVARYLESQVVSAKDAAVSSGVEKYLEKQAKSAQEKAAQAGTGVEKYMRDRG
ncbi:MAG: hypothetical protein PSU93_11655 [Methylobacter sp.]|uniref:LPXTG cell wall anchor domain-containing protein n=1 Tax=Candidatus Methylobacter titanis TaxID=3053457 RepID=A0AA43Q4Z1_9GAMM|nr:hypothetical protein [Candidatus Methylobacter titanis]